MAQHELHSIQAMSRHMRAISDLVSQMVEHRKVANRVTDLRSRAIAYHDTVSPLLETIRTHVDKLELMVDDELWPLPKYRELLFIR